MPAIATQLLNEGAVAARHLALRAGSLIDAGRPDSALPLIRKALALDPDQAEYHLQLAIALRSLERTEEAVPCLRAALEVAPMLVEAHRALAEVQAAMHRHRDAATSWEALLAIMPGDADALTGLGTEQRKLGAHEQAERCLREALRLDPGRATAWHELGTTLQRQGRRDEACDAYRKALELEPAYLSAWCNLGSAAYEQGDMATAREAFDQALAQDARSFHARLGQVVTRLEVIYDDPDDLQRRRDDYREALADLVASDEPDDPLAAAAAIGFVQPFLLPYQGRNDRELQQRYGGLLARIAGAARPAAAAAMPVPALDPGGRYRIGIVSAYFRNHSNWKMPIRGWLEHLDRDRFEIHGYHVGAGSDEQTALARALCDRYEQGPRSLDDWVEGIRGDRLHLLIFPEFGMDPTTLRLGCLRLAPVQATSWGHPQTSGLPTIDHFLSSDAMEPEGASTWYTEKLVRLAGLSAPYRPPEVAASDVRRAELGLDDGDVVFWCCQSLYKYLPADDDVFARIAAAAPASRFLFIESPNAELTKRFRRRLERVFAARALRADDHCRLVPPMGSERFAGITALADVFLDSIGWSGCNSTLEAIARDLPVITLPGPSLRGRHSLAILEELGLRDLVAADADEFVSLAVELAHDDDLRAAIRRRIAEAKPRLFADRRSIADLEHYLVTAIEARREEAPGAKAGLERARALHRDDRQPEAEIAYRELLAFHPDHPDGLHGLGVLALQTDRPALARELLAQVREGHPDSAPTRLALGQLEEAGGAPERALAEYEAAIGAGIDEPMVRINASRVARHVDRLAAAEAHARAALSSAPEASASHQALAETLQAREDYPAAARAWRVALELANPNYRRAIANEAPSADVPAPSLVRGHVDVGGIAFPAIPPVSGASEDGNPRPFWSVVIPVCNRRRYLLECLASVLTVWPGHRHMEIIVVDNGSDPPVGDLVAMIGAGIVRYLRHPQTIPLQRNWNSAVAACRGEWIHLLHDDDAVLPGFYRSLRAGLATADASVGAAFTAYEFMGALGERKSTGRPYPGKRGIARDWLETIAVGNVLNPPCMVIRREAYERLGGYSEEILYTTDWELYKRIASRYEWWYEPTPLVRYRQHPVNITAEQNRAGAQGFSIRRSIELSEAYLPPAVSERLTDRARENYFHWCLEHLQVPVDAGNLEGALRLLQEMLRMRRSDDVLRHLFAALAGTRYRALRRRIGEACCAAPAFRHAQTQDAATVERLFRDLLEPAESGLRDDVAQAILQLKLAIGEES